MPLGEQTESYRLRLLRGSTLLREEIVSGPGWTYGTGAQGSDGVQPGDWLEVAQISDRYGAGAAARHELA